MSGYESQQQRDSKAETPVQETQLAAASEAAPPAPAGAAKGKAPQVVAAEEASQKASAPSQAQPCPAPAKEEDSFDVEVLRSQVQDTLMRATQDGSLSKSLEVVRPPVARNAEQAQHPQTEQAEEPTDGLRLRMKDTLLRATEDGSLLGAMQTVLAEQNTETAADSKPIPTEELIKQVQATFSKAEQDGTLGAALERAIVRKEGACAKDVCAKANDATQKACKEPSKEEVLEQLRTKASTALADAVNSGSLGGTLEAVIAECAPGADALQDPADPKIDDLRVRMKETLLTATNDGALQTAIEKALQDTKETELRTKAVGVLAGAAEAGTLDGALKEVRTHRNNESAS